MKTVFTQIGKCVLVILFTLIFNKSFSANINLFNYNLDSVKATIENNSLVVKWNNTEDSSFKFCEVQGSEDGKSFTTIGYVMGADPKQSDYSYSFKQKLDKLKPGKVYYRVLKITTDDKAIVSDMVKLFQ